jgi:hypothetical protein
MFHHSLIPIFHPSDTLSHMYQYQQRNQYFAQIAAGFEDIAEAELKELGATAVKPAFRGLHFQADAAALYRINYTSRLLVRVRHSSPSTATATATCTRPQLRLTGVSS